MSNFGVVLLTFTQTVETKKCNFHGLRVQYAFSDVQKDNDDPVLEHHLLLVEENVDVDSVHLDAGMSEYQLAVEMGDLLDESSSKSDEERVESVNDFLVNYDSAMRGECPVGILDRDCIENVFSHNELSFDYFFFTFCSGHKQNFIYTSYKSID